MRARDVYKRQDQDSVDASGGNFSARLHGEVFLNSLHHQLQALRANSGGVLRNSGAQFAVCYGLDGVVVAVGAANFDVFARSFNGFLNAHGHGVVAAIDGFQVGMCSDVVGRQVIRFGAVPVSGLALNDGQAGFFKSSFRAVATVLTGNSTRFAFDDSNFAFAADLLNQILSAHAAYAHVVSGNVCGASAAQLGQSFHVHFLVDVDNLDALFSSIRDCVVQVHVGDRSNADGFVAFGDGVLKQGNLAFYVCLLYTSC